MEEEINHPEYSHFPEDPKAPETKPVTIFDFLFFSAISLLTLGTVVFSIFIITVKYF